MPSVGDMAAIASPADASVSAQPDGSPADSTMRTVALGVSRFDGRDMDDMDAWIASVGGIVPATWTIWVNWGDPNRSSFPMAAARGAASRGATPMIWW